MGPLVYLNFLVAGLLGAYLGLLLLIVPIWSLIHCILRTGISSGKRVLWIILIIFTGPLAGIVYGIAASGEKHLKIQSIILAVFLILGLLSLPLLIPFVPPGAIPRFH